MIRSEKYCESKGKQKNPKECQKTKSNVLSEEMSNYDEDLTQNPFFQHLLDFNTSFEETVVLLVPQIKCIPQIPVLSDLKSHIIVQKNEANSLGMFSYLTSIFHQIMTIFGHRDFEHNLIIKF